MTYDLIQTFKQIFKDDKVVLDSYKMDAGYYYLAKKDGTLQRLIVNRDNDSDDYELYKYLKVRDFCSKCLDSNKVIDTKYVEEFEGSQFNTKKKFFSNNIYTLFFKNHSVVNLCKDEYSKNGIPVEIFKKGIEKYYDSLEKLGKQKKEKLLLEKFYNQSEICKYKEKMLDTFTKIYLDFGKEAKKDEFWIKIFLEEDYNEYLRVANIYLTLKLFNKNDKNMKINNKIYGMNNYNYALGSKKPYLELKSTPYKIGSMISKENISILNNIYKWLYSNGISTTLLKIPVDWNFMGTATEKKDILNKNIYLIKVANNKGVARIDDFQYVTNFSTKIEPDFIIKDVIRKVGNDFTLQSIYELEFYTSNIWIAKNNKLCKNYLKESYYDFENNISKSSVIPNWKKDFLRDYTAMFFDFFQKRDETNFIHNLDKSGIHLIENTIIDELKTINKNNRMNPFNSINTMNLWIAYKKYFCKEGEVDEEMKINNVQEECLKIFQENKEIQTDEQYYFFAGQIAFYFLTRNKGEKLTQDMTSPFIRAGNLKKLKNELGNLYQKYNYDIFLLDSRFNNIFSQLLLREPETCVKDNKDLILAGMLSNNMFFIEKNRK